MFEARFKRTAILDTGFMSAMVPTQTVTSLPLKSTEATWGSFYFVRLTQSSVHSY